MARADAEQATLESGLVGQSGPLRQLNPDPPDQGTVFGVPASYLAFAGRVVVVPVVGLTQGTVRAENAGLPVR